MEATRTWQPSVPDSSGTPTWAPTLTTYPGHSTAPRSTETSSTTHQHVGVLPMKTEPTAAYGPSMVSASSSPRSVEPADGYEVTINVYDMMPTNKYLHWSFVGVYHSGVEIAGKEYAFGGHESSSTGVYPMPPRYISVPDIVFYRAVPMGRCYLSDAQISAIISELSEVYRGNTFHLLNR
jgi:hypothetical protein